MKANSQLLKLLEQSGAEWRIVTGAKHQKIYVSGRLAGILPISGRGENRINSRGTQNLLAQVRRAIRATRENYG